MEQKEGKRNQVKRSKVHGKVAKRSKKEGKG
jgi:hypothetical protein